MRVQYTWAFGNAFSSVVPPNTLHPSTPNIYINKFDKGSTSGDSAENIG